MKTVLYQKIGMLILMLGLSLLAKAQSHIEGIVTGADSVALPGAVVKVKNQNMGVLTDEKGKFKLILEGETADLQISYIGFLSKEVHVSLPYEMNLEIKLKPDANQLGEVVVSTGYQSIPKERATGSFSSVNNTLLNRKVGSDLLTRLDDTVPGLIFNKGKGAAAGLLIRGQSTINSSTQPLIVIDNFPYEGDLSTINPNDVESVTVLKDAAAASIWGSRAGNGVIVITTKKGTYNQPVQVTLNSNLTIGERPNLSYQPLMSSADFIENEKQLFQSGYYESAETDPGKLPFTPVIELLIAKRDGNIGASDADQQIESLKRLDVRNDYKKYFYRPSVNQQYAVNIRGGSDKQQYYVSGGYDNSRANEVGNGFGRFTLNATNSNSFLNKKLEVSTGIYFTEQSSTQNGLSNLSYSNALTGYPGTPMYPYASLAKEGNALPLINQYRLSFLDKSISNGLLDWQYRPLDELKLADNTTKVTDYRFNAVVNYKILQGFNVSVLYQYGHGNTDVRNLYGSDTYYARNEINRFTSLDENGTILRPVPLGGILDKTQSQYNTQNLRGQINFSKKWRINDLSVIAGAEIRGLDREGSVYRLYGYDSEHASSKTVDYITQFASYVNPALSDRIVNADKVYGQSDRYLSYYASGSYTIKGKYILSASGRIDQSNLYGVKTNQKGVPLYSAGAAWNAGDEAFYHLDWLPYVKLRATYGYSGNSNKNVSAYTTAAFISAVDQNTGQSYASIINPPNPQLRWEKIATFNLGLDLASRNRIIEASLEYYQKKGSDLIGTMPYPGSSGIKTFTGNYAETKGSGIDLSLNARIFDKTFKWQSNLLFSYLTDRVSKYNIDEPASNYLGSGDGLTILPREGKPLFSVYSLKWAGLDPQTGDPQGYVDGEVSKDYASLINISPKDMVYNGSARPKTFGVLRNTFSWKGFTLSVSINYRLGYYFRRKSVLYNEVLSGIVSHGDYQDRWLKPGDELRTHVPSKPEFIDFDRDSFYQFSQVLVNRADHIRLQDVNINYTLQKARFPKLPFHAIQVYLFANNLGILWKRYIGSLDPDYAEANYSPVKSLSAGVKIEF